MPDDEKKTLVAIITSSLESLSSSPVIASERPILYILAVSKKFIPKSKALLTIGFAWSISSCYSLSFPKDIIPKHIRDTSNPVFPNLMYFISCT